MNVHDTLDRPFDRAPEVDISLVVPMYNEEKSCARFFERVVAAVEPITKNYEIICINDGSRDMTVAEVKRYRANNPRIKLIDLSRNFGKEAALTAGIDMAAGAAVVPLDADLQDPPELLKEMVEAWQKGAQVVLCRRADRSSDTYLKRLTSHWFYRVVHKLAKPSIPENVGDFRLMDRQVVDALKALPERSRFMKGLFAWVGYRQVTIDYVREQRHDGETTWNYWKLWNFALDGLLSFSSAPLKIWSYIGLVISSFSVLFMLYTVFKTLFLGIDTPGYASLMTVMLFFNGVILIGLGAMGEYMARIFVEVKQRPLYLINELVGFEAKVNGRHEIVGVQEKAH